MKRLTEYYTLGSRSEPEGLTLMTRVVDERGEPVAQYGDGPRGWYKPKRITKKAYDALIREMNDDGEMGLAGLVNEDGKKLFLEAVEKNREYYEKKEDDIVRHELKKINRMVSAGFLKEDEIDDEINSRGLDEGVKAKIKALKKSE